MARVPKHQTKSPFHIPVKAHEGRHNRNQKFYNSKAWRRTARAYAESVHYLCEQDLDDGILTDTSARWAGVTDHIIPINEGGAKFDYRNLQRLSRVNHDAKSGREAQGIIEEWELLPNGEKVPVKQRPPIEQRLKNVKHGTNKNNNTDS